MALNGNMEDYITSIQKAIEEKQKLVAYEQSVQAGEYMADENDTREYKVAVQDQIEDVRFDNSGYFLDTDTFAKNLKEMEKVQKEQLAKLAKSREEYKKIDDSITASMINNLSQTSDEYGKLTPEIQGQMQTLIQSFDLGDFNTEQFNDLSKGMEKLADSSASIDSFGKAHRDSILSAKKAYEEGTGSIEAYGNAITSVFDEYGKVDIGQLNSYIDAINETYSETGDIEQYQRQMQQLAKVLAEITDTDYDTMYKALRDGFNLNALEADTVALDKFLDKNKESIDKFAKEFGDGGKKAKEAFKENFEDIDGFLDEVISRDGVFDADWLNAYKEELPTQLKSITDTILKDGEVTEVERKFMVAVATEIKNEGELKDETIEALQGLLEGAEVPNTLEIGDFTFTKDELKEVQSLLQATGWTAEELNQKLRDNGFEKTMQDAQKLKKALDELDFSEKVNKAVKGLSFDNVEGLDALKETLNSITGEENQINFVAECGQFFQDANSVEEAINNIISAGEGHHLLKYGIEFEGNEEYTRIKAIYDGLPKEIQTLINTEVIGYGDIEKVKNFMDEGLSVKEIQAIMNVEGADKVLAECSSVEEFLTTMADYVCSPELGLETTEAQEKYDFIMGLLEKYNKSKNKTTVEVEEKTTKTTENKTTNKVEEEGAEETDKKLKNVGKTAEETNGKEVKIKVEEEGAENTKKKTESTGKSVKETDGKSATVEIKEEGAEDAKKNAEETGKAVDEVDGKTGTAKIEEEGAEDTKNKTKEVQEEVKILDSLEGVVTLKTEGEETVQVAINKKKELEVDGQAVTYVQVNGGEKIPIAINEKGQLEVAGVAQTHIQVDGKENLSFAINEKGQLEVNGQAVTDVTINNAGEIVKTKEELDKLEEKKSVNVDISFNVNQAIDSILSSLGLSKKKETVEITVKAKDEASEVINKVANQQGKEISYTITANGGAEALQQVQSISAIQITNKTFTITCAGGMEIASQLTTINNMSLTNKTFSVTANTDTVVSQLNSIANRTLSNKSFSVTCSDTASAKLNAIASKQIPAKTVTVNVKDNATSKLSVLTNKKISDKKFDIDATDNAMAKLNAVINRTIKNKSFTVTCKDNASGVLSSIQSKLRAISSKTVTVTAKYRTIGSLPKGMGASTSDPQVMNTTTPVVVNNTTEVSALANTQDNMTSIKRAMASVQATYSDTIQSSSSWVSNSLEYDIDLLQDFNEQLERANNNLDLISKQAENAFGSEKARLLKTQTSLLEEQQNAIHHQANELREMESHLRSMLSNQGFEIDDNGSITNHTEKILALEKALESAKKAQDAYEGEDKNTQKSLQNAYDSANEKLTKAKDTLSQYYDISNQIGELSNEWWTLEQSIRSVANAIEEAIISQNTFTKELSTQQLEYEYQNLANQMALLEGKTDVAKDSEKVGLLQQQNSLIDQQQQKLHEVAESYREQLQYYYEYLNGKGFIIDTEGNIHNGALENFKNEANYDAVKEAYDTYVKLHSQVIPGLSQEWWDLENKQNDALQSIEDINKELEETAQKEAELREELEYIKELDSLDGLLFQQEKLEIQLDTLDKKLELTYGKNKNAILYDRLDLINKQVSSLQDMNTELKRQQTYLQNYLKNEGFTFEANGDISYFNDNVTTKEEYDDLKSKAEDYMEIQRKLLENEGAWYDYQIEIRDTQEEIDKLREEFLDMIEDANLTELTNQVTLLQKEFERLEDLQDLGGQDQLELLEKQLDLIEEQRVATQDLLDFRIRQQRDLSFELSSFGFEFDEDGLVKNADEVLDELKNTLSEDRFERVNENLEKYFDISLGEIKDLEDELREFDKTQQDILKSKLETTQKIEDEITKIYEKQVDERIKKIEEERDAQLESLEKSDLL